MRQQRSYSTRAIVLKRINLGEADRIVTLLTPTHGKIQAVAKGVRRPTSKLAGHLELLCHSQLQLAVGRDLDIVTQAENRECFLDLKASQWHMTCGFYLAELVDRFLEEHTQHSRVYFLMLEMLRALDGDAALSQQKEAVDGTRDPLHTVSQLLLRYFEIHLLSQVGYEPAFRACAHCAAELRPEQNGFSAALGGAICPRCSRFWSRPLSVKALHVLRVLQRSEWQAVPRWHLDASLLLEIERVMYDLLRFHLERDLKTWSFLEMLRLERNPHGSALPSTQNL
ncbi:DNA repair protein RecO [Thermogemmatispora sp.]|uniref:DNA repair protein RecO n=1 Tax=Thermogemmatispora sp. TaxID=1968838 RepID=UPI001DAD3D25|nr:DNA repair protein RecO [Thermogemmatispora sp.]MBX5451098.1 DNA repair protein RecO [Thermogemmatispora sp.]